MKSERQLPGFRLKNGNIKIPDTLKFTITQIPMKLQNYTHKKNILKNCAIKVIVCNKFTNIRKHKKESLHN